MAAASAANTPASLNGTYVQLHDDRRASEVPVGESFWSELLSGARPELTRGRMVMQFEFSEDWSTWERHPAGEELVVLISGKAELILEHDGAEHATTLAQPGEFVLVPRNVWHTARARERCAMLFVTPGEGTENRPR
jgi:quercetin dioxygenase-like cupin family protein